MRNHLSLAMAATMDDGAITAADVAAFAGATEGTPMDGLHTEASEVAQALLIVMRRGSLRAAEEITGHKYETIGEWLRRASEHAEALTSIGASGSAPLARRNRRVLVRRRAKKRSPRRSRCRRTLGMSRARSPQPLHRCQRAWAQRLRPGRTSGDSDRHPHSPASR